MKALLIGMITATLCMTAGITNDYGITTSESHATHTTDLRHACTNAPYGSNIVNQMTTDDHIIAMRADGNLDAVIKSLADSGDICRVLGHSWGMSKARFYAVYAPDISYRTCRICGKQESKSMSDWE